MDEIESDQIRLNAVQLVAEALLIEPLSLAGDPTIAEHWEQPTCESLGSARTVGNEAREAFADEDGDETVVGTEP